MSGICKNWQISVLLALCLLGVGCHKGSKSTSEAARVGKVSITPEQLQAKYGLPGSEALLPDSLLNLSGAAGNPWEAAARRWANEELLYQEAQKQGIEKDSLYQIQLANLRRHLLIQRLRDLSSARIQVDSAEVYEEYSQHRSEYAAPDDQIYLIYAVAPTRELANRVRQALQSDLSLSAILALDDLIQGEDLGWVSLEQLQPRIAKPAFGLAPGGVSYPLKHDSAGYIVLYCRERRLAGTILPFEDVYAEVHSRVLLRKQFDAEQALRDSLWKRYEPKIFGKSN